MREGRNNEMLLIDDQLIGINLGADYVSEHEWGIKPIRHHLGIDTSKLGLEGRIISKAPENFFWLENFHKYKAPKTKKDPKPENKIWSGFYFDYSHFKGDKPNPHVGFYTDLTTAWDEKSFAAFSCIPEQINQLKEIYEAFSKNDIAIWIGGKSNPFQNPGLAIAIASRIPKEVTDKWHEFDVEHNQLMADFAATGIEAKLKAAGKGYFALSPSREEDGSLIFWLNPTQQKMNNYGWFKLEHLEAWIKDEGPIPMKKQ